MTWQRRLRDIAIAGGLAGGCATSTSGNATSGTGGAKTTSGSTGGTGGMVVGQSCNANPDPCCICELPGQGQGGSGGASCAEKSFIDINGQVFTCQDERNCVTAPDAKCCSPQFNFNCAQLNACQDAGFTDAGCP